MKTFVIGDIHGCYNELQDLLDKLGVGEEDTILSVGDLVDRGEDSPKVLNFFQTNPQASSIMGNHEHRHIQWHDGLDSAGDGQTITRYQMSASSYDAAITYMKTMPIYLELDDAIIVHGYYEAGLSLSQQKESVMLGAGNAQEYMNEKYDAPWYEYYDGDKPLIMGHKRYNGTKPFIYNDKIYGIDTDCVKGGALTALVLPDFNLVSVPARANHWANVERRYKEIGVIK